MDYDPNNVPEETPPEGELPSELPTPAAGGPPPFRLAALVQANNVEVSMGAALAIVANEARVERAGSVVTVARDLSLHQGGSQWLLAGEARLERSGSGIIISRQVDAPNARIGVVAGGNVEGNMQVGILLANRVEGNVQALMDTKSAVRFGAAFGAVFGMALLLRRLLGRR